MRAMTANAGYQKTANPAQGKQNFEKMSAAADQATDVAKETYSTTMKGAQDYSAKVLEFAQANTISAFEYARELSSVKSPTEFFELSNTHLRDQFERLSRQAQELAAIAQKMTGKLTESIKGGIDKVV
jgi:phasin